MDVKVSRLDPPEQRWKLVTAEVERLTAAGASVLDLDLDLHLATFRDRLGPAGRVATGFLIMSV